MTDHLLKVIKNVMKIGMEEILFPYKSRYNYIYFDYNQSDYHISYINLE